MNSLFRSILLGVLAAAAVPAPVRAEAVFQTSITIALPPVLPPLVAVEPGVQVVENLDDEVFFVNGWYWARRGPNWYRARDHRRAWVYVEPRFVPHGLQRIPPGQYRRFEKARWKAEREEEKARRHEAKEAEKEWKKKHKDRKHDRED